MIYVDSSLLTKKSANEGHKMKASHYAANMYTDVQLMVFVSAILKTLKTFMISLRLLESFPDIENID